MIKNKDKTNSANDTLKARGAARVYLGSKCVPPSLLVTFANPKTGRCDSRAATIGDREFTRGEGETAEVFQARVRGELPMNSPVLGVMWPDRGAKQ